MDIVEIKGVNPKMLAGSASSITNTTADPQKTNMATAVVDETKLRRKNNQAYCEFDIVAAYHARKKQRSSKNKHVNKDQHSKDHSKAKKGEKVEKSELSKKIDDLTARNEKIKQMLDDVNKQDQELSENIKTEKRHRREHKSRRSTRCCPGQEKHSIISDKIDKSKHSREKNDSRLRETSETQELSSAKHRSRREHSEGVSSRTPKITVRLRNNNNKESKRTENKEEININVPESKSQLLTVTNYQQKQKSLDRKTKEKQIKENKNDIITVYENTNILEETDSIMSRDTLLKSKTHIRNTSFSPEDSRRHNAAAILECHTPNPQKIIEPQEQEAKKVTTAFQPKIKDVPVVEPEPPREISPIRTITPRKELSFSNLNLTPNIYQYVSPARMAMTQTSVSRIESPGYGSIGIGVHSSYFDDHKRPGTYSNYSKRYGGGGSPDVLSQTTIALRDIMQVQEMEQKLHKQQTNSIKSKFLENTSYQADGIRRGKSPTKGAISKNSRFHKTRGDPTDRMVEIASKTCHNQKVTFTVEGTEPPRRVRQNLESNNTLKIENVFNLQVFPGLTITNSDLKESDLMLLSHGMEKSKSICHGRRDNNESLRTFDGSGSLYPYMGLNNTISEFRHKESSEISYKFKKKSWSNKELPKKKLKDRRKREKKSKVTKQDMAIQTGLDDLEEELNIRSEREIGVSTDCNFCPDQSVTTYKDIQVQAAIPQLNNIASSVQANQTGRISQSESNITIFKEKFQKKTDFTAYKEAKSIAKQKQKPITKTRCDMTHAHQDEMILNRNKQEIYTSGGENFSTSPYEVTQRESPRKHRPHQKHRNCSYARVPTPHPSCHPVMSTGSIREVHHHTKKTRSKSLSHERDSLAEKININKETIRHHNKEIAALEKCLNEILHRLGQDDSVSKEIAIKNEKKMLNDEISNDSKSELVSYDVSNVSNNSNPPKVLNRQRTYIKDHKSKDTKPKRKKSKASKSSFQRRKIYSDSLKKRHQRYKEKPAKTTRKPNVKNALSPTKVRSVYKNPKGFISSATSMSSKLSDIGSTSPYPQSIPSLNINRNDEAYNPRVYHQSHPQNQHQDHHHHGIVKPKHKLQSKVSQAHYSKKKTKSIYDMLLHYIHLTKDVKDGKDKNDLSQDKSLSELSSEESKIVILSVSSLKLRNNPDKQIEHNKNQKSFKKHRKRVVEDPSDSESPGPSNKPFFIANNNKTKVQTPKKVVPKLTITSEDSLEYDTSRAPDLCPLTAIFNFEPPKRNYLVYNTEVITHNKPKIDVKTSPQPSTSTSENTKVEESEKPKTSTSAKLMTIQEEKIASPKRRRSTISRTSLTKVSEEREKPEIGVADLSPVLVRRGTAYPSYGDVMKSLENMTLPDNKPQPKLTSFNCNDRECSNLIFNYTSKKDPKDFRQMDKQSSKDSNSRGASFSCERHESSAYHTLTTLMDSKSERSFPTPSESDVAIKNESGYESSKKSNTFKNFFKKKTLFEVFKNKIKAKKYFDTDTSVSESLAGIDTRSPACIISEESIARSENFSNRGVKEELYPDEEFDQEEKSPYSQSKTVLWFNFRKKMREAGQPCDPWCINKQNASDQTEVPLACHKTCQQSFKCMPASPKNKDECPCMQPYEQQREQCKKYASKVLMEAAKRQKGYRKQYEDFKEMPLDVLMGNKKCACKPLVQGCPKSYANKVAAMQAKSSQRDKPIQVTKSPRKKTPPVITAPGSPKGKPDKSESDVILPRKSAGVIRISSNGSVETVELETSVETHSEDQTVRSSEEVSSKIRSYTDHEIFDRLLSQYERKDAIAGRLSHDELFHQDQMLAANSGVVPDLQVQPRPERSEEERMRGPRFSDRPKPLVHITTDTTVRPDDIGTCFARGFRPDNLMLSGDACFHINKQDKIKMSPYMLKNTESIIDFSERETPLDFLLALGFMVDEASNALKDDDIRSRLLAAITEFEDEENEEKIVKKQLKTLFVNVYTVAEKEASVSGRTLSANQVSLLRILVAKYRAGLHPHLELIARYIGQGLLENEIQLEAAMIFLSRLDTSEVKLKEFENYCGITCQLQDT
ncbi:uncharacterized protein [Atheta coriaria]|uniref:uncharacterized protein isoform X3 n=1 Tax=Dalotia coriaria TaxID=877792 RepID=UPI0031F46881